MGVHTDLLLAAAVWIAAAAPAGAAVPGHALHLTLKWGGAPAVEQTLVPQRGSGGERIFRWDDYEAGCCDSRGELAVDRESIVHLDLRLHNSASTARAVRLGLVLSLPRGPRAPTELSGVLTGRLSGATGDVTGDPDLVSLGGAPVFTLLLNGTPVASSLRPPVRLSGSGVIDIPPHSFAGRYGPVAGDATGRELGIRLRLRLGPGATMWFRTQARMVTAPFPVGVLALGGVLLAILVLVRRRRYARPASARPAAHRTP